MRCTAVPAIHTIGHSTRTIDAFTALLADHDIEFLIDVRRWPASRRYPHFNREALAGSLNSRGIDYVSRVDLGGFRKPEPNSPNAGWRVGAFRAYADFMLTDDFEKIMVELEELASGQRIAVMCAEALPWRCHRQLLADAFLVRGWSVRHILDDGCREHELPAFAQPKGRRLFYPGLL